MHFSRTYRLILLCVAAAALLLLISSSVIAQPPNPLIPRSFSYPTETRAASVFASGLSGPFGLVFDSADNLYVAEETAGRVLSLIHI